MRQDMISADERLSLVVTQNDTRSRRLVDALDRVARLEAEVLFDRIDPITRYTAGALSFRRRHAEWWVNYQMHGLVARRRRRVLQRELDRHRGRFDALLMWGSWFHPRLERMHVPFFNYIDQSLALEPVLGEPRKGPVDRRRAHGRQAEIYRDSSGVLTFSQWAHDQTLLAHPTLPRHKVHVVGWGPGSVDLSSEIIPPAAREPVVLHVSNDFHRKGLDYLIATAERVTRERPGTRFVVIGKDYGGMQVPRTSAVTFLGRITDREELAGWFRRACVFFLPHRFDRSPHVLVEAMSAGLPFVTSSQGGPLELVQGGAGVAVPIGDVEGYATAVMRFLDDPGYLAAVGARGKALMMREYTWEAVARRIVGIVEATRPYAPSASLPAPISA